MTDTQAEHEFEIDRDAVYRYSLVASTLIVLIATVWVFGAGILLAPLWWLLTGPPLHRRQVRALRYWLDGGTLRINQGFIFLQRKAIPLDRVTDIVLAQGPLARHYGVWNMKVQTAGTGQQMPEGTLVGVVDAEAARDLILKRRDRLAGADQGGV